MVLESVHFLSVLPRRQPLSILQKYIHFALLHEEPQVQCSIALGHCSVVQHSLPISVPRCHVQLVFGVFTLAEVIQSLDRVKLAVFDGEKEWSFLEFAVFDVGVGAVVEQHLKVVVLSKLTGVVKGCAAEAIPCIDISAFSDKD